MATSLAVGMYVTAPNQSTGRIVDRRADRGVVRWLVKMANGTLLWIEGHHLQERG